MKTLNVVAAIIQKEDKVLIAQRSKGVLKGLWEFPGGKVETNETNEEALVREIKEELDIDIQVTRYLATIEYDYEDFHLSMASYYAKMLNDDIHLNAHSNVRWVNLLEEKDSITWVKADIKLVEAILNDQK